MRQASKRIPDSAEKTVRDIRRATRRHHSAEEKIRIVLEGLRGEDSIAELCRKEGINQNLYYRWSKEILDEVLIENRLLKKSVLGDGEDASLDIPRPRSSRSSNWWNSRRSQSPGHWLQSGSRDRRSTTGTADTKRAGSKLWRMASRDRGESGTRSLTRSKRRSSIWPLRSRACRRVSSPSTSPTQRAALCQKPPFIGS